MREGSTQNTMGSVLDNAVRERVVHRIRWVQCSTVPYERGQYIKHDGFSARQCRKREGSTQNTMGSVLDSAV